MTTTTCLETERETETETETETEKTNEGARALLADWMREREKGLHAFEIAQRLHVPECQLLASACGGSGSVYAPLESDRTTVSVVRLDADWSTFIAKMPSLGVVKTVTRNPYAIMEVEGYYGPIDFLVGSQTLRSIDLRIVVSNWAHAFAVREETPNGTSRGFQFFDKSGRAIHKVYLRDHTNGVREFERLVREHISANQSTTQPVDHFPILVTPTPPDEHVDRVRLRKGWLSMKESSRPFRALLNECHAHPVQALRLIGDDLARRVEDDSLEKVLHASAGTELRLSILVGNSGVAQIRTGTIKRVVPKRPWVSVLSAPDFDLHVRTDRIDAIYVVRKPRVDEGIVTTLEAYDEQGEQIAVFGSKRIRGRKESSAWRDLVESLRSRSMGGEWIS